MILTLAEQFCMLPSDPLEHLKKLEIIRSLFKKDTSLLSCFKYNFRTKNAEIYLHPLCFEK